jgi:hypothetical protein
MKTKFYFSLILVFVCSLSTVSQIKSKATQTTTSKFQTMPFDSNVEKLPPNFLGHNAAVLLPSLFSFALEINKGCGKFEKTEPCQVRLNNIYKRPISSKLTASDRLAFSIPRKCDYNPNLERVECSNTWETLKTYNWFHRLVESKTYVGQNAFGVKKLIKYKKFENIIIEGNKFKPEFVLGRIPPSNAQILLPNLRMLVLGTLLQPFLKIDPVSYKPTLDDPEHIDGNNYSLVIAVEEVWLYDFASGKVLAKEKFVQGEM